MYLPAGEGSSSNIFPSHWRTALSFWKQPLWPRSLAPITWITENQSNCCSHLIIDVEVKYSMCYYNWWAWAKSQLPNHASNRESWSYRMVVDKSNPLPLFSLWFLSYIAIKGGWMTLNVITDLHKNVAVITSELKLCSSKCFPFWGTIIALRLGRKLYHHYCFKGASVIKKQHIRACPHRKEIISNQQCYNPIGCCSVFMDRAECRKML